MQRSTPAGPKPGRHFAWRRMSMPSEGVGARRPGRGTLLTELGALTASRQVRAFPGQAGDPAGRARARPSTAGARARRRSVNHLSVERLEPAREELPDIKAVVQVDRRS